MTDIFDEVSAELRRERAAGLWARYRWWVIGGGLGFIILLVAGVAFNRWVEMGYEGNSARYDAVLTELPDAETTARAELLQNFATAEDNNYGALAALQAALELAESNDYEGALNSLDGLIATGQLPRQILDFVRLQAAILTLDMGNSIEDVEARLARLLQKDNALRPLALETLALANMLNDNPLQARALYQEVLGVSEATGFTRERVEIMLSEIEKNLSPGVDAKLQQSASEGETP